MKKSKNLGSLLEISWKNYLENIKPLIIIVFSLSIIPTFLISIVQLQFILPTDPTSINIGKILLYSLIFGIVSTLIYLFFLTSVISYLVEARKNKSVNLDKVFNKALNNYPKALLLGFLVSIATLVLGVFLIIPAIIFLVYTILTIYFIVVEDETVINSFKRSCKKIHGRWWKTFGYLLILFLIFFCLQIPSTVFSLINSYFGIAYQSIIGGLYNTFIIIFLYNYFLDIK